MRRKRTVGSPQERFFAWVEGKGGLQSVAGLNLLSGAEGIADFVHAARDDAKIAKHLSPPTFAVWHKFYRRHLLTDAKLFEWQLGSLPPEAGLTWADFSRYISSLRRLTKRERADLQRELRELKPGEKAAIESLVRVLVHKPMFQTLNGSAGALVDGESAFFEEAARSGWLRFLMMVWVPSMLHGRQPPTRLLRRARLGHAKELSLLLRIDASMVGDPGIVRLVHSKSRISRKSAAAFVAGSLGKPLPRLSERAARLRASGLVSAMFGGGAGVDAAELRELADIAHHANTKGQEVIDATLPDAVESMSRQVLRERKAWERALLPATPTKRKR